MRCFLPSLCALQAFKPVAPHLSFTRAAKDLMLVQSAILRRIRTFATLLGVRLLECTGSRLVLTDAGRIHAEELRHGLDQCEARSIDAVRGPKASLSLMRAAPSRFLPRWQVPRLPDPVAQYPDIPIEFVDLRAALTGIALAVVSVHFAAEKLPDGRQMLPFEEPVLSGESYWIAIPEARAHRSELPNLRDWQRQGAREDHTPPLCAAHQMSGHEKNSCLNHFSGNSEGETHWVTSLKISQQGSRSQRVSRNVPIRANVPWTRRASARIPQKTGQDQRTI